MDDITSIPQTQRDEKQQQQFELMYVKQVYDAIAPHYTSMRTKRWKVVTDFLESLPSPTVLLDAGCGNGKYFYCVDVLNGSVVPAASSEDDSSSARKANSIFMVGLDGSMSFLNLVYKSNYSTTEDTSGTQNPALVVSSIVETPRRSVVCSDLLSLPYRDQSFDCLMSIAVIHHQCTPERRVQCLVEFCRVLTVGGKALVTGWTRDISEPYEFSTHAEYNAYLSSISSTQSIQTGDTFVNWKLPNRFIQEDTPAPPEHTPTDIAVITKEPPARKTNQSNSEYRRMITDWHRNQQNVQHTNYFRYYHMFSQNELEQLLNSVTYTDSASKTYKFNINIFGKDKENYYCIVEKIKCPS